MHKETCLFAATLLVGMLSLACFEKDPSTLGGDEMLEYCQDKMSKCWGRCDRKYGYDSDGNFTPKGAVCWDDCHKKWVVDCEGPCYVGHEACVNACWSKVVSGESHRLEGSRCDDACFDKWYKNTAHADCVALSN